MIIAVMSEQSTQVGMSSFISLLGSFYAKTQHRKVAILTTGDIHDIMQLNDVKESKELVKSINVYRAIATSNVITDDELFDYGYRLGKEEVFAFENPGGELTIDKQVDSFKEILRRIHAGMTLVEIKGDLNSPINASILAIADVRLYVFNHSRQGMALAKHYRETSSKEAVQRTGFVCLKYDRNVCSEKTIAATLGESIKRVMIVPYNSLIAKKCLDGTLNTMATLIATGNAEAINLRPKLLEVLQYIYDTQTRKVIKGVGEWSI